MTDDWRKYPFRLVPDDSALDFPAAEGEHADQESDTWFIAGELTGSTGRSFAFLTIFNKNRPGGSVVADFYTMSLFDCGNGTYGTYTDYDMPPASMRPDARPKLSMAAGHLDIDYQSSAGPVTWTTCRDDHGELQPYTYRVSLRGVDQAGHAMQLDLTVTPTRAPVPVGADTHNGKIVCFGQPDTYSYFQTGMVMSGTLHWGELEEQVSGEAGHVDRQWFPKYAGGGGSGGDPRARSHEWRTINLDNGVDLSIWRQFDRMDHNALQPFSGVTASYPDPATTPECVEDVEVAVSSYVRWPDTIQPLLPPLAGRELVRHHTRRDRAARRLRQRQVEHVELVEELDVVLDAVLVQRLQDHVAGAVGGVAGPAHRSLAVVAGVPAEPALVDAALGGAVERHPHLLEVEHRVDGFLAHDLDGVLVGEVVATLAGVEGVPLPVVFLHVRQCGAHAALGRAGVGALPWSRVCPPKRR